MQKGLLKELGSVELIIDLKAGQDHSKHLKRGAVDFLSSDIGWSDLEAQCNRINWGHRVDLTVRVY